MDSLTRPEGSQPEDFLISRRSAAGLLVAGYAVAALAAEAKPVTTPTDGLIVEETVIPNGASSPLPAYVARPGAAGRHPAILVVNEVFGVHAYIKDICRRLAREGYAAVAPHFFYRSGVDLPAISDIKKVLEIIGQASDAQVDGDVSATTDWLQRQPFADGKRIGVTGFCWGGAVTWRTAMVNPDVRAGVAWYGRLKALTPRTNELKAPVLGLYGGQDKGIPVEDVEAFRAALKAAGKDASSIYLYPDAEHGFHADYRVSYDEAAAKDAWARMIAFFRQHGIELAPTSNLILVQPRGVAGH